jgi:hypothetical protein
MLMSIRRRPCSLTQRCRCPVKSIADASGQFAEVWRKGCGKTETYGLQSQIFGEPCSRVCGLLADYLRVAKHVGNTEFLETM